MKTRIAGVVVLGSAMLAAPAAGQVAWDAPLLVAPRTPSGFSIHLVDPEPGDGIGVMAGWRTAEAPGGVGFRVGLAEDPRDDIAVFGGADFTGWLVRASDDLPIDFVWVLGAGLGIGDEVLLSFPAGISLGGDIEAEGLTIRPYATPRVILDAFFGDDDEDGPGPGPRGDDDDLDLDLAVDIGLDLVFDPTWALRFGATVGDREALSIGVAIPGIG